MRLILTMTNISGTFRYLSNVYLEVMFDRVACCLLARIMKLIHLSMIIITLIFIHVLEGLSAVIIREKPCEN